MPRTTARTWSTIAGVAGLVASAACSGGHASKWIAAPRGPLVAAAPPIDERPPILGSPPSPDDTERVIETSTPASTYTGPHSPALRGGRLRSPMPGGFLGGWAGDTGLDIAGDHLDVFAIAAGTLDYSEWGHTLWTHGHDTPYSVRLALDEPIAWGEHRITHVYYTHLSKVETTQTEGASQRKHVEAGERIGVSGIGNGVPHLHLGLLLDDQVAQDSWTFILREGDVRKAMGNYRNGELLRGEAR